MSQQPGDGRAVTRVEFDISDGSYPFVSMSETESCSVILEKCLPQTDDTYAEFLSIEGARPDQLVECVEEDAQREARVLDRTSNGGLVEVDVQHSCPIVSLADAGAVPQTARGVDGQGTVVADVPRQTETAAVIEEFLSSHSEAELTAKQHRESIVPLFGFQNYAALTDSLTDRQREVLESAHGMGYFDHPKGANAGEVAAELGVSRSTFAEHLAAAQSKVLESILTD